MNEIAKNEMRNYLSAAGFFVFALAILVFCVNFLSQTTENNTSFMMGTDIVCSILLLLVGVLLAVLGKRDLTAITFLMLGSIKLLMSTARSIPNNRRKILHTISTTIRTSPFCSRRKEAQTTEVARANTKKPAADR